MLKRIATLILRNNPREDPPPPPPGAPERDPDWCHAHNKKC